MIKRFFARCLTPLTAHLIWFALFANLFSQESATSSGVTKIAAIEDVIRTWRPDRHLFVKGNLGIGSRQLDELENWLTKNGPHWTIVIMDEASDASFLANDGREYRGMDAIEYALGYGLSNRTDFGKLEHPKTMERDGAVFAMSLKERKFSYFGSDAQDRRGLGESNWVGQLDQPAFRAMRSGGRILDAVKDTVKSIDEQLTRVIQGEADNARRTLLFILILVLLSIAAVLWLLNRRRRTIMIAAEEALARRELVVAKETEGIDRLFIRNEELLGSKEKVIERGYVGATKLVSEQALDYVDDLFIMSKEVRRVVKDARELINPNGLFSRLLNLFSGSRYQQAMHAVTGKPLKFSRLNGLPGVLREQSNQVRSDKEDLDKANRTEIPDEITLTFEEVFHAFQQRGVDAENALNTVENCLTNVHEKLSDAQDKLGKCIAQDKRMDGESRSDGYFRLPDYLEVMIPAVEIDLEQADKLSAFDAVGAMQEVLPVAQRKMNEATALGSHLLNAREKLFPQLKQAAAKLGELRFTSHWIDLELSSITYRANQLMKVAATQSIGSEVANIASELTGLVTRGNLSMQLAERIRQELGPEGESLRYRIQNARSAIARELSLPESALLNEIDLSPEDCWATAGKNLEAAGVAVSLGQNNAAQAAIDVMIAQVARADNLIQQSTKTVQSFGQDKEHTASELKRLSFRLPQVKLAVETIRRDYVSSTLQFNTDAASKPTDGPATAEQMLQSAASPLNSVEDILRRATDAFRQGKVLQAAVSLNHATSQIELAHAQLDRTEQHVANIESRSRENRTELSRLSGLFANLRSNQRDPLVTQDTLNAIEAANRSAEVIGRDLATSIAAPNPFEITTGLIQLQQKAVSLEARCTADRKANSEAARAVAGARGQQQIALQHVRQSQTDGIPDSPQTIQANDKIAILNQELVAVESQLREPHGDWKQVDSRASKLQADLSASTTTLIGELRSASQAIEIFNQASQIVFQAEQWTGHYGIRVSGSPGVRELERARTSLQQGNYNIVLEVGRIAADIARKAIEQGEREVIRRQQSAEREAEATRRRNQASTPSIFNSGGSSHHSSGGSFGGGSSSNSSSSSSSGSGFSRSGW